MRKRALSLTVLVLSLAVATAGLAAPAGAGPNDPTVLFGARPEPGTQQGTSALEGKIAGASPPSASTTTGTHPGPTPTSPGS